MIITFPSFPVKKAIFTYIYGELSDVNGQVFGAFSDVNQFGPDRGLLPQNKPHWDPNKRKVNVGEFRDAPKCFKEMWGIFGLVEVYPPKTEVSCKCSLKNQGFCSFRELEFTHIPFSNRAAPVVQTPHWISAKSWGKTFDPSHWIPLDTPKLQVQGGWSCPPNSQQLDGEQIFLSACLTVELHVRDP